MSFALADEHRQLAESAQQVLADTGAIEDARRALEGPPTLPRFWAAAVDLGWLGLHLDEDHGGQGYGLAELAVVVEALGYVCSPGPFLPVVIAGALINRKGSGAQRQRWLPELAAGRRLAGLAAGDPARDMDVTVGGDGSLTGRVGAVLGATTADLLLVPYGQDVIVLEPGPTVVVEPCDALDPTRGFGSVRLAGARPVDVLPGARPALRRIHRALLAVETAGSIRACLERTHLYATQRMQFGRPIGSFMAVKHHLADMLADHELATAAAWDAVSRVTSDEQEELITSAALVQTVPALLRCARRMVQLHGGIGFTWEHDAHLFLRRAGSALVECGSVDDAAAELTDVQVAGARRSATVELPDDAERVRAEVREFAARLAAAPDGQRRRVLARSGYLVPHWPAPFGRDAGPLEQLVVEEELPDRPSLGMGEWLISTVVRFASPEQLDRWIWPSLEGDLHWCQLFSEPEAGSDAAAVRTRGRHVDGGWIVSGQKTWTSLALQSQWGLATVRTDPDAPKHRGLTVMAIDMSGPGVLIRPVREMTGDSDFNEVFLDEVMVPDEAVIGVVGDGWRVARSTFGSERVSLGAEPLSMVASDLLDVLARRRPGDLRARQDLGVLLAEAHALAQLGVREVLRRTVGDGAGPGGDVSKLVGSEHAQRVAELGVRLGGAAAVLGDEADVARDFLFSRCLTIAGGTSEIMRTLIAERHLGLPRDA